MSNLIKTNRTLRFLFITTFISLTVFFAACTTESLSENTATDASTTVVTCSPEPTDSPTPEPEKNYSADFSNYRIIGSSIGIFSGQILAENSFTEVGFAFFSEEGGLLFELPGVITSYSIHYTKLYDLSSCE